MEEKEKRENIDYEMMEERPWMDAGGNQSGSNDAATQSIIDKVAMVATILLAIIVIVAIWVIIF